MEFTHKPVLLQECLDGLAIKPQGVYLDGTPLPLADCGQGRLCRAKARRFSEGGFACRSV